MLPVILRVEDNSRTAEARGEARRAAHQLGFDEIAAERAAIVATELCSNLLKHAGGGTLVITPTCMEFRDRPAFPQTPGQGAWGTENHVACVELLALDRGPGIANWQACLADGYSTTGTSGNGLGAITRLSAFADVYSQLGGGASQFGRGTVLLAVMAPDRHMRLSMPRATAIRIPKPGQEVCGDDWAIKYSGGLITVMLADGLGHGPEAAAAAACAVALFNKHQEAAPKFLLESIHCGLRHTRGAAVSVAQLDEDRRTAVFAGLGHVAGRLWDRSGSGQQMISLSGTAGVETRAVFREFTYPWLEGSALVMHSDGLNTHGDASDYPGILTRSTALLAGALFRDCYRGNDDATIVTVA